MRTPRSAPGRRGWLALALLLAMPAPAVGRDLDVHGESAVFASHGVAMAWGMLKGASDAETQVVLRIVPAGATFAVVRIEGVDPFSQNRRLIVDGQPLGERLEVRIPRATFAGFPRREIRFYRTEADWQAKRPALSIFYLGVPDTTPEFLSEAALDAYLTDALARTRGPGQGNQP